MKNISQAKRRNLIRVVDTNVRETRRKQIASMSAGQYWSIDGYKLLVEFTTWNTIGLSNKSARITMDRPELLSSTLERLEGSK